ncbi:hypothetical protein INR49_023972 [Caranx melampygus]|nr:hypothetical protein INR49_023972 [Caranx melampygus]
MKSSTAGLQATTSLSVIEHHDDTSDHLAEQLAWAHLPSSQTIPAPPERSCLSELLDLEVLAGRHGSEVAQWAATAGGKQN